MNIHQFNCPYLNQYHLLTEPCIFVRVCVSICRNTVSVSALILIDSDFLKQFQFFLLISIEIIQFCYESLQKSWTGGNSRQNKVCCFSCIFCSLFPKYIYEWALKRISTFSWSFSSFLFFTENGRQTTTQVFRFRSIESFTVRL